MKKGTNFDASSNQRTENKQTAVGQREQPTCVELSLLVGRLLPTPRLSLLGEAGHMTETPSKATSEEPPAKRVKTSPDEIEHGDGCIAGQLRAESEHTCQILGEGAELISTPRIPDEEILRT